MADPLAKVTASPLSPCSPADARWDDEATAEYVATDMARQTGTEWTVVCHHSHFHVLDTGRTVDA